MWCVMLERGFYGLKTLSGARRGIYIHLFRHVLCQFIVQPWYQENDMDKGIVFWS
jgi:hypothetical protein